MVYFCLQIALLIFITLLTISVLYRLKTVKRICVVVLGDIGRSPRMMYHSLSLASEGFEVDLVGFGGSSVLKEVQDSKKIHITQLPQPMEKLKGIPSVLHYIIKTVVQSLQLILIFVFKVGKSQAFLVQNPPSIPVLAVVWVTGLLKGSSLIIDWHNYGFTILSLNLKSKKHPLVRCSYWYEAFFGKCADGNICVTEAMKKDLEEKWNIKADVMYDRPPLIFKPVVIEDKHQLFQKLSTTYPEFAADKKSNVETRFTQRMEDGVATLKKNRPALLVSSTSWTDDEDFNLLLDAFVVYEAEKDKNGDVYPDIVCAITGKGPLKEYYIQQIKEKNFSHISIITPWLTHEDYPTLIGSADLGICLHFSSSGLDLPMKVVDMFGCQLPVCAVHYECLTELVKHDENGLHFKTSDDLASQLLELLSGFPENQATLERFRSNLASFQTIRWDNAWQKSVKPLFAQLT